jgi:membrane protease subunit HflC
MRKLMLTLIIAILAAPLLFWIALATVLVAVDRTEFVYVTQFGRHVATYDGGRDDEAGLHWRWPWPIQSVQRLDRRLQSFDLPGAELLTHDPRRGTIDRTLTMVAYVCWRISDADGVDWFIRRVGTPEQARTILGQRVSSQLGAVIGRMEMDDLINTESGKVDNSMRTLRTRLLDELKDGARREYGIDLVDIRLRRHSYPEAVRQAIFSRIISERNKKVADYQSEGAQLADNIKSEARRDAAITVSEARARAQELKGQADADADRIRNAAQGKDPEFYAFLKKLEEYQRILGDNKTVLLLSSHRDLFDLLFSPPKPAGANGVPRPAGAPVTARPASGGGK